MLQAHEDHGMNVDVGEMVEKSEDASELNAEETRQQFVNSTNGRQPASLAFAAAGAASIGPTRRK